MEKSLQLTYQERKAEKGGRGYKEKERTSHNQNYFINSRRGENKLIKTMNYSLN